MSGRPRPGNTTNMPASTPLRAVFVQGGKTDLTNHIGDLKIRSDPLTGRNGASVLQ